MCDTKVQAITEKNKIDFIKIKTFSALKDTIKKVKLQLQNGREYVQVIYLIKYLYPEYIKTLTTLQLKDK